MKIFAISGDGGGAGKTYAARMLGFRTITLADAIRDELKSIYPAYNWFDRTQAYKNGTLVPEWGGKSVRQVMLEYGQQKCEEDPCYWVKQAAREIEVCDAPVVAIDDIRKICEIQHIRQEFKNVVHLHVVNDEAQHEPEFEADALYEIADYVIQWK